MRVEDIARIAHEANRAYCVTLGDTTQQPWDDAPEWQRESAIAGVQFHLANPHAGPADSHREWMQQKVREGWTYGPVKDPEKKEHPSLVAYAALPEEQRVKDRLFIAIVRACRQSMTFAELQSR